ncbi:MAG TPA: EamA family transporter, partial [Methanosarcina sp.]|nr:EamA family transporter [Methanosarcina sp.]
YISCEVILFLSMSNIFEKNSSPFTPLVASCILSGTVGIFVKGIKDMDAGSILFYRLFFGFAVILVYLMFFSGIKDLKLRERKSYLFLLGILNAVTTFSYFSAIKYTSISEAVLLLYTAPIYVTLLSPLLLKERISFKDMFALILSISGILLAVNPSGLMWSETGEKNYTLGILFGLLSGLSYGCSIIVISYLKENYSTIEQMFWSTAICLLLFLPFGISVSGAVIFENLYILISLGVLVTAFASFLYLRGISRIKAQTAAVISLLEPLSSICFCCILLGEPVHKNTIEGCLFILGGAALISCDFPKLSKILKGHFQGVWAKFFQPYMPLRPGKL